MSAAPRTWLFALIPLSIAFKLWLSAVFPVTGDEAYFIHWGAQPALGYYDHPPMVGWWLALILKLSSQSWALRLPVVLLPAFMSLALYAWLRPRDEPRAALAAIALLLVPLHVWNVFITTDTPLVLFSFLSGMAFWRAVSSGGTRWYLLAGALLGLAALSKYFAAILGLAYLVHVLASPKAQRHWGGLLACYAAALPFIALNLYWNYENCWANLMFNLYNRHDDAGLSWRSPLVYALCVAYLLALPALYFLARQTALRARLAADSGLRLLVVLGGFPFVLFGALALVRQVGLHWLLSFVPFFFAACALLLDRGQLRRTAQYAGVLALAHVLVIAAASWLPLERWNASRLYDGIVFHFRIGDVLKELRSHEPEFEIAADGYSAAATLSYYRSRYVFVFGEASSHARHDDLVTDFRALEGRNIAVLRKSPPREADYEPYFRSVEYRSFRLNGVEFHVVLGRGFDYRRYRDDVLALVRDRYYRMPSYLPRGHCNFCERYFESACPVRQP